METHGFENRKFGITPEDETVGVVSAEAVESVSQTEDVALPETVEINIETVEGLGQFLMAAEDVYADSVYFDVSTALGDEIYNKLTELQELVDKCRFEVLPEGQEISDEQFDKMQSLYNELISLRDTIIAGEENVDEQEVVEVVEEITDKQVVKLKVASEVVSGEQEKVEENETASVAGGDTSEITPEVNPAPVESKTDAVSETFTEASVSQEMAKFIEEPFSTVEQVATEALEFVKNTRDRLEALFPLATRTEEINLVLGELDTSFNRAVLISSNLEELKTSGEDVAVMKLKLDKYHKIFAEITKNVQVIDKVMQSKYEASQVTKEESVKPEVVGSKPTGDNESYEIESSEDDSYDLSPKRKNGDLHVLPVDGQKEGEVRIIVAEAVKERIRRAESVSGSNGIASELFARLRGKTVGNNINATESGVVAATEKQDPINDVVPNRVTKVTPREIEKSNPNSLTDKFLQHEDYVQFIQEHFGSNKAFDQFLRREAARRDLVSVSAFERWLNEVKVSPFEYLRDKTMSEIDELANRSFDEIKSTLAKENIKYESFLVWYDLINEMREGIDIGSNITLGELYAITMIESEMSRAEAD